MNMQLTNKHFPSQLYITVVIVTIIYVVISKLCDGNHGFMHYSLISACQYISKVSSQLLCALKFIETTILEIAYNSYQHIYIYGIYNPRQAEIYLMIMPA